MKRQFHNFTILLDIHGKSTTQLPSIGSDIRPTRASRPGLFFHCLMDNNSLGVLAVCLLLFILSLIGQSSQALAEDINFPDTGSLKNNPHLSDNSLFPGRPSDNNITVNADVLGDVAGGIIVTTGSVAAATSNNTVTINAISVGHGVWGGLSRSPDGSATASNNMISLNSTKIGLDNISNGYNNVIGGNSSSNNGAAISNSNSVIISDSTIYNHVNGAASQSITGPATANNNTVIIDNESLVYDEVSGGTSTSDSGTATANSNTVNISAESVVGGIVVGGNSETESGTAFANSNTVNINGGSAVYADDAIGGKSSSNSGTATANGNTVNINGKSLVIRAYNNGGNVIGGRSQTDNGIATTNSNNITISNLSVIDGGVYGSLSQSNSGTATAANNSVKIFGESKAAFVFGGYSFTDTGSATSNYNSVNIDSKSKVNGNVYSGYSRFQINGLAIANNNITNISGESEVGQSVFGGYSLCGNTSCSPGSSAIANNNIVTISGKSTVTEDVYGGSSGGSYSGSSVANNNIVDINGNSSVSGDVYGGLSTIYESLAKTDGNLVRIREGSEALSSVYGGFSLIANGDGSASDNQIVISDSTVAGSIYGGFVLNLDSNGNSKAINNTVTLIGSSNIDQFLFGGLAIEGSTPGDSFSGNTLNIWSPDRNEGITVGANIISFENYNFIFQADAQDGAIGLNVAGYVYLYDYLGSLPRGSNIESVNIMADGSPLPVGHTFNLFETATLDTQDFNQSTATGLKGVSLIYEYALEIADNALLAKVTDIHVNPQTKALSEGLVVGISFVNQGQDLAAGQGLTAALSSAGGSYGLKAFSAFSGGSSRYNTGSHVNVQGASVMAGLAWGTDINPGRLTLGTFFEAGNGDYDSHNSFNGSSSVTGNGDTKYIGGGLLGRFDFNQAATGHAYIEGSGRLGQIESNFSSADLRDAFGRYTSYNTDSRYYGLHLGGGYVWNITDKTSLDLYGKYFWTHQEGDSVTLSTGDQISFKDSDSQRLRAGSRISYAVNDWLSPYFGVAYEHEFDGKAEATAYGRNLDAPELKGGTGIGELGLTFLKSGSGASLDLGIQGYTGKREGISGSLQFKYEF